MGGSHNVKYKLKEKNKEYTQDNWSWGNPWWHKDTEPGIPKELRVTKVARKEKNKSAVALSLKTQESRTCGSARQWEQLKQPTELKDHSEKVRAHFCTGFWLLSGMAEIIPVLHIFPPRLWIPWIYCPTLLILLTKAPSNFCCSYNIIMLLLRVYLRSELLWKERINRVRFMWTSAFFIDFLEKCYFEIVHQGETVKILPAWIVIHKCWKLISDLKGIFDLLHKAFKFDHQILPNFMWHCCSWVYLRGLRWNVASRFWNVSEAAASNVSSLWHSNSWISVCWSPA